MLMKLGKLQHNALLQVTLCTGTSQVAQRAALQIWQHFVGFPPTSLQQFSRNGSQNKAFVLLSH